MAKKKEIDPSVRAEAVGAIVKAMSEIAFVYDLRIRYANSYDQGHVNLNVFIDGLRVEDMQDKK